MLEKSIAAIHTIKSVVNAWLLPFTCILCSQPSDRKQDLCSACLKDLPIITQSCARCANKLSGAVRPGPLLCGSCIAHPPPFRASYALFAYEPPVIRMILNLKFNQQLAYARILGELMAEKIQQDWYRSTPLPDVMIPIPLHAERLKARGFNQALELARPIAAALHLKIDYKIARRIKNTPAQMHLPAEKRQSNVKDAFMVDAPLPGQNIALLDDVMTTGTTAAALSQALLQQGAASVVVWCCARA